MRKFGKKTIVCIILLLTISTANPPSTIGTRLYWTRLLFVSPFNRVDFTEKEECFYSWLPIFHYIKNSNIINI